MIKKNTYTPLPPITPPAKKLRRPTHLSTKAGNKRTVLSNEYETVPSCIFCTRTEPPSKRPSGFGAGGGRKVCFASAIRTQPTPGRARRLNKKNIVSFFRKTEGPPLRPWRIEVRVWPLPVSSECTINTKNCTQDLPFSPPPSTVTCHPTNGPRKRDSSFLLSACPERMFSF